MRTALLILTLSMEFSRAGAAEMDWSKVQCPDDKTLAVELLQLEIAGARVPNFQSACLEQKHFAHVAVVRPEMGEVTGRPKLKYVDEKTPFTIKSLRTNDEGRIEVNFVYHTKNGDIADVFSFRRYEGGNKELWGCALMMLTPKAAALRRTCEP